MHEAQRDAGAVDGATLPLTRFWWAPIAFIAAALLLLLLAPIFVNHRVTRLRRDVVEVADDARVRVNDLQVAYIARLYAHDARDLRMDGAADSAQSANIGREGRDEAALDSLVGRLGPVPSRRLSDLRGESVAWQRLLNAEHGQARQAPLDTAIFARGVRLLGAAEALDLELVRISNAARDRVRFYEQVNLVATSALIPLALVALGLLFWLGWRTMTMARAIESERTELQRATDARTALIHGVTHDVKNPLGAAIGYVELLQDGVGGQLPPDQLNMLTRVRRLMDTALLTVAELLEAARTESRRPGPAYDAIEVGTMIDDVLDDYAALARERRISLDRDVPSERLVIASSEARVRRIIGNLLSNAIKYADDGGRVRVSVAVERQPTPRCIIAVCDDGPGVAPEYRERVFDEFFRGPGAGKRADGHGVGLAVSRRLARDLGGDVRLVPSPLGGAGFALELPAR